ncbi:MAG: glycosyltransferase, partial [Steroidobacteraceae bacterium]
MELTQGYLRAFRRHRPQVVLAEFGPTAVRVLPACELAGVPLVAHFHGGFDISAKETLQGHAESYPRLLRKADATIAVSKVMRDDLIKLGAPPERVHHIVCGVDPTLFAAADPSQAPPHFLAVGQFLDFKAPHLTILAFARVFAAMPEARLHMIGAGPLLQVCRELANGLGLGNVIQFMGKQPHSVVQQHMRTARCFVQHSIHAASGNAEG